MNKRHSALRESALRRDPVAFDDALSDCIRSDQLPGLCDLLIQVLPEDWHFRHEDVVSAMQWLRCRDAVLVLERRATDCPEYLAWDDNYALARKCTWALADIGTEEARQALIRLSNADVAAIQGFAQKRLDRWSFELERKADQRR